MAIQKPNCGDPALQMGLQVFRQGSDVLRELFADRQVTYAFKTRVAIRRACDILGLKPGDEVLAPGYNCGSELDALRDAGVSIRLYPVSQRVEIDTAALARMIGLRTRAIYLTHYFGFLQPHTAVIRALCDAHGLLLIEDCALSLLSGPHPAEGRLGDVSVFCFHKFFPVLGGGALVVNAKDMSPSDILPRFAPPAQVAKAFLRAGVGKVLGPGGIQDLKRRLGGAKANTESDSEGEPYPDMPKHYYFASSLANRDISGFTARAMRSVDVTQAILTRRRNYLRMLERLDRDTGLEPLFPVLPPDITPLSMPVRVRKEWRNGLALSLKSAGIPATAWWSGYNRFLDFSEVPEACALKDSVLSLPLHQYLETAAIDHIADQLNALARQRARSS